MADEVVEQPRVAELLTPTPPVLDGLTAPSHSVHIGASGLVFGYLTYCISRGVFARKVTYILGGIVTFMVYGGVLWGLLPGPGVSWQGRLFGAIGGVAAAWLLHAQHPGEDHAV